MAARHVAFIGAGDMVCGPEVLSALAMFAPIDGLEVSLYDPHPERLGLMDLLLRRMTEGDKTGPSVFAEPHLELALEHATDVLVCLYDECCERMSLRTEAPSLENFAEFDDPWELRRGDYNRPTPPEELNEFTRSIVSRPVCGEPGDVSVFETAVRMVVAQCRPGARLLNLTPWKDVPDVLEMQSIGWPVQMSEAELASRPHQVLRWVRADDPLSALLVHADELAVYGWLAGGE